MSLQDSQAPCKGSHPLIMCLTHGTLPSPMEDQVPASPTAF